MIESYKEFFKRLWADLKRISAIILIILLIGELDSMFTFTEKFSYLTAVISSTSIVLAIAAFSHLTRRIFFPEIDLKEFAKTAKETPLSASIVFLGVCVILSTLIVVNVSLLK